MIILWQSHERHREGFLVVVLEGDLGHYESHNSAYDMYISLLPIAYLSNCYLCHLVDRGVDARNRNFCGTIPNTALENQYDLITLFIVSDGVIDIA